MADESNQPEQPQQNNQPAQSEPAATNKKSNKKVLIIVGSILGLLIVLGIVGTLLAGYFASKATETVLEAATGSEIDVNSDGTGEMSFTDDEGNTMNIATETEMPADFPAAVPLYDNASLVNATTTSLTDEGTTYSLTFETNDSVKQVTDHFSGQLSADNGWKMISKRTSAEFTSLMATNKAKDLHVMLSISTNSGEGENTQFLINTRDKTTH